MVVKMNNKDERFYKYMGKIFGSRLIQNQTNDRIYDDNNKLWYISLEEDLVVAFVSVSNDIIKNVYGTKEEALKEILKEVKKENRIKDSTVTVLYENVYKEAGYKVIKDIYKNFVLIA
ncbi:MAG: hypothetical protein HFJ41_00695 [Clostridia bacterium]|nr:hypothetical protein [Clostridia bacterium]